VFFYSRLWQRTFELFILFLLLDQLFVLFLDLFSVLGFLFFNNNLFLLYNSLFTLYIIVILEYTKPDAKESALEAESMIADRALSRSLETFR
jgi:hypothetical protein